MKQLVKLIKLVLGVGIIVVGIILVIHGAWVTLPIKAWPEPYNLVSLVGYFTGSIVVIVVGGEVSKG